MRKMESLINGASNGFRCQLKKISLLHKELLGKDKFIKSLLETQTAILTHYQIQH